MKKLTCKLFALAAAVAAVAMIGTAERASAQAAVTFSTFGIISGSSDVLTNGTLVQAQFADILSGTTGAAGPQTVNGVTFADGFTNYAGYWGNAQGGFGAPFTGDAGYNAILTTDAAWGGGTATLTLTGLVSGNSYQVELWGIDDRGNSRTQFYSDSFSGGNTSTTFSLGSNTIVLGNFTASGSTQNIYVNQGPGGDGAWNTLQAFQVREVPEPSTWAMMLGGLGMLTMFRRRRA